MRKHHAQGQVVKRYLLTPVRRMTGKKTIEVVDGGGEDGERYFLPPFPLLLSGGSPISMIAEDVFEHDDRVIDEARKCQRQAAQQHGVDGAADGVHDQQAGRSADSGIESSTAKVARRLPEKQQNHDAGEHQADPGFLDEILDARL